MNKLTPKNCTSKLNLVPYRSLAFVLPCLLFLNSACTTVCQRHEDLVTVLNDQSDLLQKVQAERASAPVASKIQSDPTLSEAEAHLTEALRSLSDSNQAMQAALKN